MQASMRLKQSGFSAVELALMLTVLLPLTMSALYGGLRLQQSWQLEEAAMAAVRFVSDLEPSSLINNSAINDEIAARCLRFSEKLSQYIPELSLSQCSRIDAKTIAVELYAPSHGPLGAARAQSRWVLADHH